MAAPPSLNQVYISESVLSKGAQLLLKTATFYLISRPGLSLLFPLRHAAAHLHESFPGRRREAPTPRRYLSSPAFRRNGEATATGGRAQACAEHGGVWVWGGVGGGPPFLMHCLPAAPSPVFGNGRRQSVIRAPRSATIKMIRCNRAAYRPVEGCAPSTEDPGRLAVTYDRRGG